jgi:hypothetical protein
MYVCARLFSRTRLGSALPAMLVGLGAFSLGQVAAAQSTGGAHAIPDLSGYFAHQTPAYSPPAQGGIGPLQDHPDYPRGGHVEGIAANAWIADYENPILKPENAAEVKRLAELEISGGVTLSAFQLCRPLGVPLVVSHRENIQLLQEPDRVTIIYQRDQWTRHIHLNVAHSKTAEPSWYGESIGHYEGDTLVVDTIALNGKARVDRYGSLGGNEVHVVERYRVQEDGQTLQVDFTVESPDSFNAPWNATQYYPRSGLSWEEVICAENNRDPLTGGEYEGMPVAENIEF